MKLTNAERLILVMLAELHERLGIENGLDTKLLLKAIYSDNTWALAWEMPGIVREDGDSTPPEVHEVASILSMWEFIELAYASFGVAEKERISAEAKPFGTDVRFRGFDGNNEARLLGIATFLVEELDRCPKFKGRDLNSHCPSIQTHRRMLVTFDGIRTKISGNGLSVPQVIELLGSMRN
jgi:uncharacterized protein